MEVAVIAPPMRIPAVGSTAIGSTGTAPLARIAPTTGSSPVRIGSAVTQDRGRSEPVIRWAEVPAATTIISSRKHAVSHNERSTNAITALTARSWVTARTPAITMDGALPRPASRTTNAAPAVSATSRSASGQPMVTALMALPRGAAS